MMSAMNMRSRVAFLLTVAAFVAATARADSDLVLTLKPVPNAPIGAQSVLGVLVTTSSYDAQEVTVTYPTPAGTTFYSVLPYDAFTCTAPAPGAPGTGLCRLPAAYSHAQLSFLTNVPAGTTPGTVITHSASVTSPTPDPNLATNSGTATTIAAVLPQVGVHTTFPASVVAGAPFQYNVTVHNNGPVATRFELDAYTEHWPSFAAATG